MADIFDPIAYQIDKLSGEKGNNIERIKYKRGTSAALEASTYVPAAGEIVIATDTVTIKVGDGEHTWANLPLPIGGMKFVDNYDEFVPGKALDAIMGKDLNDRLTALEGVEGIACPEITIS